MIRRIVAALVASVAVSAGVVLLTPSPAAAHNCGSLTDCLPSGRSLLIALAAILIIVGLAILFWALWPAAAAGAAAFFGGGAGGLALASGGTAAAAGAVTISASAVGTGAVTVGVGVALAVAAEGVPTGGGSSGSGSGSGSGSEPPTNSAGEPYPQVTDPRTGQPISHPGGNLQRVPPDQRVSWGRQERYEFIREWHNRGYPRPEGGWDKYDIHHIRPREYGGSNDFSNLVPVRRDVEHKLFNAWWRNY